MKYDVMEVDSMAKGFTMHCELFEGNHIFAFIREVPEIKTL